jgi:hypothetical protein
MEKIKRFCLVCNKALVKIGCDRLNGKLSHSDWKNRKYHKKCMIDYDFCLMRLEYYITNNTS